MMMLNIRANQNAQTHVSNLRCDVRKLDQTIWRVGGPGPRQWQRCGPGPARRRQSCRVNGAELYMTHIMTRVLIRPSGPAKLPTCNDHACLLRATPKRSNKQHAAHAREHAMAHGQVDTSCYWTATPKHTNICSHWHFYASCFGQALTPNHVGEFAQTTSTPMLPAKTPTEERHLDLLFIMYKRHARHRLDMDMDM